MKFTTITAFIFFKGIYALINTVNFVMIDIISLLRIPTVMIFSNLQENTINVHKNVTITYKVFIESQQNLIKYIDNEFGCLFSKLSFILSIKSFNICMIFNKSYCMLHLSQVMNGLS